MDRWANGWIVGPTSGRAASSVCTYVTYKFNRHEELAVKYVVYIYRLVPGDSRITRIVYV